MSEVVPSQNEDALCRCKALYLGTSIFNSDKKKLNDSRLNITYLQESIAQRYPVDGSNFARGVQTCLSVYPSGIQMEHASTRNSSSISALFFYPIKSLVYCGALRFVEQEPAIGNSKKNWMFVPLDTPTAQTANNVKYPPLFVAFVRGIDPNTKRHISECHVFVVGMVKTAMSLVESCQKSFNNSKMTVNEFYKKYGNVPVVFCMKDDLSSRNGGPGDSRMVVKSFDLSGYHYATDQTPIDLWQLFDDDESTNDGLDSLINENKKTKKSRQRSLQPSNQQNVENSLNDFLFKQSTPTINGQKISAAPSSAKSSQIINPYAKTENLVTVEKRIDPMTGQNVYVRYMNSDKNVDPQVSKFLKGQEDMRNKYSLHDLIYGNHMDLDEECSKAFRNQEIPPIIIRQEKTPSPIIVEKYVKKKSPQVIIKEIHVQEPAPPPIKVVEKMDGSQAPAELFSNERFSPIYQPQQSKDLNGSSLQIQTSVIKNGAPSSTGPQLHPNRFRNMICHTTYETLRGEPVIPQPTPQFYSQHATGLDKCSTSMYNSSNIIRRPLLKDINFYLNKAENQLMRQHQNQPLHSGNRNSSLSDSANYDTTQRRLKPSINMDGKRKSHIENSNRENLRESRHYSKEQHYDDTREISPTKSKYNTEPRQHISNKPTTQSQIPSTSQQLQPPRSILTKKQGAISRRGDSGSHRHHYYRAMISEDLTYY